MALGILFVASRPGLRARPHLLPLRQPAARAVEVRRVDRRRRRRSCSSASALLFKELQAIAFDEEFAEVVGLPVEMLFLGLLALTSLAVVVLMRVVGVILAIALLTLPAATSRQWTRSLAADDGGRDGALRRVHGRRARCSPTTSRTRPASRPRPGRSWCSSRRRSSRSRAASSACEGGARDGRCRVPLRSLARSRHRDAALRSGVSESALRRTPRLRVPPARSPARPRRTWPPRAACAHGAGPTALGRRRLAATTERSTARARSVSPWRGSATPSPRARISSLPVIAEAAPCAPPRTPQRPEAPASAHTAPRAPPLV